MLQERPRHLIFRDGPLQRHSQRGSRALVLACLPRLWLAHQRVFARRKRRRERPSCKAPTIPGSLGSTQPVLGTGTFRRSPFRVSVSVREGYDDNVYTTSDPAVGSFFTNGDVVIGYKFGNARTRLDVEASGGVTYFITGPLVRNMIHSGLTLTAVTRRAPVWDWRPPVYLTYQSEPDFNTGFGINRRSGNYFYTTDKFSTSYQWAPRFSTVTSYTLGVINYEDSHRRF